MSAAELERCMAAGGVAVFPSDTVYGLACDPEDELAAQRLYLLKRRPLAKPSAVMWFSLPAALEDLDWLGGRTRSALQRLLPGPIGLLVSNPGRRFPLACGEDPGTLGIRVPSVPALAGVGRPVLQSSANLAGGPDPRTLQEVPRLLRETADLVIDGGPLPGTPSTMVDLRRYETASEWSVVREGAVSASTVAEALNGERRFMFDPDTYAVDLRAEIPLFDRLQDEMAAASVRGGAPVRRILELGTGTGETARRLLACHPGAELLGVDESSSMLAAARSTLPSERVELIVGRIEQPLPAGPFDLVASALCVHHLDDAAKADLFRRVASALAPGGLFVLGDVVVPEDPAEAKIELTPGWDKPSAVADQVRWLRDAGFERARVTWSAGDLAVLVAEFE